MKRILLALVGTTAIIGLAGTASAADLGARNKQVYKAPVAAPVVGNWAGFYIGVNGGGGWGGSQWSGGAFDVDPSGGMIGGTIGYNWQLGTWVLGLEGDADWSNIKGSYNGVLCGAAGACETKNDFLATIRGRVGYSFGQWMPYVTGGVAIGNIKASYPGFTEVSETNAGWTAGAGVEFAFAPHWSAKVEYLHVDLGDVSCGAGSACNFVAGNKVDFDADLVRGGINYKF